MSVQVRAVVAGVEYYQELFGNGSDGSLIFDTVDNRWEDANGTAIGTVANKWTLSGTTLTLTGDLQLLDLNHAGGTLLYGADGSGFWPRVRIKGTRSGGAGLSCRAGLSPPAYANSHLGATVKSTAGAGNTSGSIPWMGPRAGRAGGGAAGGGDGTNLGGAGRANLIDYLDKLRHGVSAQGTGTPAGTTGAGSNGQAAATLYDTSLNDSHLPLYPGATGPGGGSGALKQSGGSNVGGAGGNAGYGGGIIDETSYINNCPVTYTYQANGDNGSAGSPGVATNAAGDVSGGGGGGPGGGGGTVRIRYRTGTFAATLSAAGGSGGTGGAGFEYNASARASSNGGNGGAGSAGYAVSYVI